MGGYVPWRIIPPLQISGQAEPNDVKYQTVGWVLGGGLASLFVVISTVNMHVLSSDFV